MTKITIDNVLEFGCGEHGLLRREMFCDWMMINHPEMIKKWYDETTKDSLPEINL